MLLTVVALVISVARAGAATSRPILTKAEYRQLLFAEKRIKTLTAGNDNPNFRRVDAICRRMRQVSPLITAVRAGCLELVRLGGDDARLNIAATKCGIDPPSETALLTCLIPSVRRYYEDAERFYLAEVRVDRIARARGFSSTCTAVIGDSPGNIRAEGRLAADLEATVTALRHQNPDALQSLSDRINRDVNSVTPGPTSLSLCPHE